MISNVIIKKRTFLITYIILATILFVIYGDSPFMAVMLGQIAVVFVFLYYGLIWLKTYIRGK